MPGSRAPAALMCPHPHPTRAVRAVPANGTLADSVYIDTDDNLRTWASLRNDSSIGWMFINFIPRKQLKAPLSGAFGAPLEGEEAGRGGEARRYGFLTRVVHHQACAARSPHPPTPAARRLLIVRTPSRASFRCIVPLRTSWRWRTGVLLPARQPAFAHLRLACFSAACNSCVPGKGGGGAPHRRHPDQ